MSTAQDMIFNLKLTSKQFMRASKKAEKRSKAEKLKIKKAIQDGNPEGARIYAENAIREHKCSTTFMGYSSKMDGLASRLRMQSGMNSMIKTVEGLCQGLQSASEAMDMKKVNQVMKQFDTQMDHIDTVEKVVMGEMDAHAETQIDRTAVDQLISQVAAEHQLALDGEFAGMRTAAPVTVPKAASTVPEDDIDDRLAKLLSN
ncbi:Vacuolar protein sorting 46B (Vps46B) [Monocercomonoides exilis]|uniref:Vacuolar protein sorting 46B (Vps46B) n=1 Tax=Monocercomonoides exilis TaxID=2049356 RepID=UPI00355A437A|nr:Vacuolar protein sorting 46B (Vps46B) [Monocercomonoides exilis]|eukprot:MONOS_2927.1-p1 / transcript=MONOS_2927.1 / gene=MONOS_2927 / organism=Monocercomonoides_exilis_PA203 / gene_product= Vacuolar protein sorting 46B (Vps46B) / transcript_product= Vacuolar protein sorting 46B (Vps46B) / location=Mono_scaffold00064:30894-31555(+) / protein_length=202 / sequence_SO=supercontig / SO=protein_coding / is_pseudo=false